MMNSGSEANEVAIKLARRWAYRVKGVPQDQAVALLPTGCYWGRTLTQIGVTSDPNRKKDFGPFDTKGFDLVKYNDIQDLENKFKENPNICAYLLEPIQGEAGVIKPDEGYMKAVHGLCKKYNVLMIADEIQTGFGRTGKLMCHHWENVRPDMITLGKSLSGGMMPISAVMADASIIDLIGPGEHGSTYGYMPLACKIAKVAAEIIIEENLV